MVLSLIDGPLTSNILSYFGQSLKTANLKIKTDYKNEQMNFGVYKS